MIEKLSNKLALSIYKAYPEGQQEDVLKYGITVFLHTTIIILFTMMIGIITGKPSETALSIIGFWTLRSLTGGFHISPIELCEVVSISLLSSIPHFKINIETIQSINIITILLLVLFSSRDKKTLYAMIIVCSNLFFINNVLALAYLSQSLTLIKWRR